VGVWRVANRINFVVVSDDVGVDLVIEIRSFTISHSEDLFDIDDDIIVSQLNAPAVSRVLRRGHLGYPDVPDVNRMQAVLDLKIDGSLILSHSSCLLRINELRVSAL